MADTEKQAIQENTEKEHKNSKSTQKITAWERVEIARDPKRKTALDYIGKIFDEFIELHGDRNFKDDKAIVCGLAKIWQAKFYGNCRAKRKNDKGKYRKKLWNAKP